MSATKDDLKSACGFAYDKDSTTRVPDKNSCAPAIVVLTGLQDNSDPTKENTVNEHRVAGAARNAGGKVEEGFGRVTGDTRSQVQGVIDQAQGTAENLYGQAKDAASGAVEGVRKTASSFEDIVRHTIEDRPYTAVAIAVGLGWLLGRTHRPL